MREIENHGALIFSTCEIYCISVLIGRMLSLACSELAFALPLAASVFALKIVRHGYHSTFSDVAGVSDFIAFLAKKCFVIFLNKRLKTKVQYQYIV